MNETCLNFTYAQKRITKYRYSAIESICNLLMFVFFIQRASAILNVGGALYYIVPIALAIVSLIGVKGGILTAFKKCKIYIVWVLTFTSFCLISYFWSFETDGANNSFFIMNYVFMIPVCLYLTDKKRVFGFLRSIFFAILFIELYSVTFGGLKLNLFENALRLNSENFNANTLAILSVISVFIVCMNRTTDKPLLAVLKALIILFDLVFVFLSGSRKGFLMLLVGFLIFLVFRKQNGKFIRFVFYLGIIAVCVVLLFQIPFFYNIVGIRIMSTFNQLLYGAGDNSSFERISMINYGLQWFSEKPIFGWGIDTFKFKYEAVSRFGFFTYSHNNYVEILYGLGILGFILYYSIYIEILIKIRKQAKQIRSSNLLMFSLLFMVTVLISEIALVTYSSRWLQLLLLLVFSVTNFTESEQRGADTCQRLQQF